MAGNVYEWTDSWNDEKKTAVLRGGAWREKGDECRCALRSISLGGWVFDVMGFRCARTIKP
jgi:formylglycine-generating enzyme required for sulfatase activity